MKTPTLILTLALSIASPLGWAQQEHHQDASAQNGAPAAMAGATIQSSMPGGGMGMMGGQDGMLPMMQRMREMQSGMDRIMDTDDPEKRMELMQAHRQQLQETMGMMGEMQQGGGMGTMKSMGMMGGQMNCMGMMEAYRQMDKRLDLIQQLLEQRLDK
ncbi:hypothetical protein CFI10_14525 [Marinobacterium iners]|jgi:hypothetical protein|uniref:hypothetical protein n=1 Tax=Marinobacterium TaxID=48075 RepID=UPI001A8C0367|nr:hypothetical protein [Marinobacterium iners]QSR36187.1 hypothetical protein CFI10_14525 [Marinobacterium iners]